MGQEKRYTVVFGKIQDDGSVCYIRNNEKTYHDSMQMIWRYLDKVQRLSDIDSVHMYEGQKKIAAWVTYDDLCELKSESNTNASSMTEVQFQTHRADLNRQEARKYHDVLTWVKEALVHQTFSDNDIIAEIDKVLKEIKYL